MLISKNVPPQNAQNKTHMRLLRSTALVAITVLSGATFATAQTDVSCDPTALPLLDGCEATNAGLVVAVSPAANTELAITAPQGGFNTTGFSISVDNQVLSGALPPYNPDRAADIALSRADISVRYDGLDARRLLNVSTTDIRASYPAGAPVSFRTSSNYPYFIARSEVRILDLSRRGNPVIATLPAQSNGTANWVMPEGGEGQYAYVLRVFDSEGRYDETQPLTLTRTARHFDSHATVGGPLVAAGEGEDRTRIRNIPTRGGVITVSGQSATRGGTVIVMGEKVAVDTTGHFVVSRLLPAGDHVVSVDAGGRSIVRDVNIPRSEWFHVGILDLTAGLQASTTGGLNTSYVDARAAFYVKGQTENGWTITSSVDTQEGPIEDLFRRLSDKDPRRILDRLRTSNDMYPTYGDDSVWYDDTPTSGAFYLRAESDSIRATWGNFTAGLAGPGMLNSSRDLYGAELRYQSPSVTANGDSLLTASIYAAQPDTLAQRDILRGTGGSVYFLTRQDVSGGTTTAVVQIIDPVTGYVQDTRPLVEGVDFTVDHFQGVIFLSGPLASIAGGGGLISGGASVQNLVVQYEYTPTNIDVDSTVFGGRAEAWLNDELRVGASAMLERTAAGDQMMAGADLRYRVGEESFVELEVARTSGPGFDRSLSTDGGLTIVSTGGAVAGQALGVSLDGHFDLQDMGFASAGHVDLYYESREAGFATLTESITSDQTLVGFDAEVEVSPRLLFGIAGERFERATGDFNQEIGVSLAYNANETWSIAGGVEQTEQVTIGNPAATGERTDIGVRVTYAPSDEFRVYAFGQYTLDVAGGLARNDRFGIGAQAQVTEKLAVAAEASGGSTGAGGSLSVSYAPTAENEIYLGYTLDPTRNGASGLTDNGSIVLGARYRVSESLSTYTESVLDIPGDRRSLTQAYGLTYTPDTEWTLGASFETGEVLDDIAGNFYRTAVSFGAAYAPSENLSARARLEYRTEDGIGLSQDRETWAFSAGYMNKVSDNWRFLADIDALYSNSASGDLHDGEYLSASLGYAYRPIDNERLNLLLSYRYLHDLPGADQVSANGTTDGSKQRSHVFSVNGNYDLTRQFTLGAKFGYRASEVADRGSSVFMSNTAALTALRLDWHVVHAWDILAEGRMLFTPETGTTETGALVGVYRHFGENTRFGIGYEWGGVSDDLTDINYSSQGLFLNITGKF